MPYILSLCNLREVLDVFEEVGRDPEIRMHQRAVTTGQLSDGCVGAADFLTTVQA